MCLPWIAFIPGSFSRLLWGVKSLGQVRIPIGSKEKAGYTIWLNTLHESVLTCSYLRSIPTAIWRLASCWQESITVPCSIARHRKAEALNEHLGPSLINRWVFHVFAKPVRIDPGYMVVCLRIQLNGGTWGQRPRLTHTGFSNELVPEMEQLNYTENRPSLYFWRKICSWNTCLI